MRKQIAFLCLPLCFAACKKEALPGGVRQHIYYHVMNGDTVSIIYIPNTFAPTEDGINDYFYPQFDGFSMHEGFMQVYSAAGGIVFYTQQHDLKWDGMSGSMALPAGTYFYHLQVTDTAGYTFNIRNSVYLLK